MCKALILIFISLLIVGCGEPKNGDVHIIQLEDGTKCAVYSGPREGGLSCDWGATND